jgi:hypothetical protein
MADEGKLREQVSRGAHARRIFEDELTQEVFSKIEKQLMDSWRESLGDESDIRERTYLMLRLHDNYKSEFRRLMTTGDAASRELLQTKDPNKLTRMFNGRR